MKSKKILIIGGSGYVGSSLTQFLRNKNLSIDICDFNEKELNIDFNFDYKKLKKENLEIYTHIVLLAGHSSVKNCEGPFLSSFKNNVDNFVELVEKLSNDIQLIYASSSSVYGDSKHDIVSENMLEFKPNNNYDLTKYLIDVINIGTSNKKMIGLRFGTVNGYSPIVRTDVMINAMVNSAIQNKHIKLFAKEVHRPILGTSDLNRAMFELLNSEYKNEKFFNLASFNQTAETIAEIVARICNVPILEIEMPSVNELTNIKMQTKAYDFSINTKLFEENYNFKFNDTIETITNSLIDNWMNMKKITRSQFLNY